MDGAIGFRRLAEDDLPLLHRWLNDPRVVQWWEGDDVSWPGVLDQYSPDRRDPDDEAVDHIAVLDGRAVGWICWSPLADDRDAEELLGVGVSERAAQIDYLVGDGGRRRRGLGSRMIAAFVQDVLSPDPRWDQVVAVPYAANRASWRALERAGFTRRAELEDHRGTALVMVRDLGRR